MKDRNLLRIALLQSAFFIALGAGVPFLGLYFKRILIRPDGSPADYWIGLLFFMQALMGVFTPLLAGFFTDKFKIENRVLTMCSSFVFISAFFLIVPGVNGVVLPFQARLLFLLAGMIINGLFIRPIVPMIDTEILNYLNQKEGTTLGYGRIRSVGTVSWVISACFFGWLLFAVDNLFIVFAAYGVGFAFLALAAATGFRPVIKPGEVPWYLLKKDKSLKYFLVFAFIMFFGLTSSFNFTSWFMDDMKVNYLFIGLAFGLASLPEIPMMLNAHVLLRRLGSRSMILLGTLIHGLKLALFFLIADLGNDWLFIGVNLLGGLGYGFLFNGAVQFIDSLADRNLRATYQNLYHLVSTLAMACGGLFSSWIIHTSGSRSLMAWDAGILFGAAAFLALFVRQRKIT